MTIMQRIVLILSGIVILFGSYGIIFSSAPSIIELLGFYIFVFIPTWLFYRSFTNSKVRTKPTTSVPRNQQTADSESLDPVLFITKSIWPFQLFPDTLIIKEKDISLVRKTFFWTGWTETVLLEDIYNVLVSTGPFFASIEVEKRLFERSFTVNNLWKVDAMEAKKTIDGLLLAHKTRMNITLKKDPQSKQEMLKKLASIKDIEKELSS